MRPTGVVEAFSVEARTGFNLCVQWHPEWQAPRQPGLDAAARVPSARACSDIQTHNDSTGESIMVARDDFTFSELEQWLNERRVTEIECLVPDLTGVARGKILPREKFTEDRGMRLPEAVVAMGVTGEFPDEGPYYDVITPDRPRHAPAARPDARCASCPGRPTRPRR